MDCEGGSGKKTGLLSSFDVESIDIGRKQCSEKHSRIVTFLSFSIPDEVHL